MRQKSFQLRKAGLLAAVCAVVVTVLACAFALPSRAMAYTSAIAYSFDSELWSNTYYTTIEAAIEDGCSEDHPTIVMLRDWEVSSYIAIPGNSKIDIDMNGYSIKAAKGVLNKSALIDVGENTEVTLRSSVTKKITYEGYDPETRGVIEVTTTTGGLVTESVPHFSFWTAIHGSQGSVINLEGITIAGNEGTESGGVLLDARATVNMRKGASIEHNIGSGVYANGESVCVNIDDSSITNNIGSKFGGGIYVKEDGCRITMTNGSKIDHNVANAGGGVYFNKSKFELTSSDGTGVISNNKSTVSDRGTTKGEQSGGGIHVDQKKLGENKGLIEGITICDNYSAYDGGGLELDQESTVVRNCTITGNWCKYEGGGAYVCNDKNTFENCIITGNACNVNDEDGNYEGGGIYVWCDYDVGLKGLCVIKGNTRGKDSGDADDVFLRENVGATAKAYITGSLAQGSSVGVRSGITGDRRVAKNFKPASKDCLFMDLGGYYVSYGTDEGGDAWQRHTTKEFALKLNGQVYGKYRNGTSVALALPATKEDGKIFWRWETKYSTGLYPLSDYFTEKSTFSNALSFSMPQNEVNLVPTYVDRVKSALFAVAAPEAGKALSTSGQLVRTDGGASASATVPCAVYWYEVEGGEKTLAAGVAKAGTTYEAYVSAPPSDVYGLYYDDAIKAENVIVRLVSSTGETKAEEKAAKAYVTLSNSLAAFTAECSTDVDAGKETKTGTVGVQLKNKGLLGEGEAAVAALDDDGEASDEGLIGTAEISFTYNDDADTVKIAAPEREGFNFCNWEAEGDAVVSDESVVNLSVSELLKIKSLTAVYTPVATALEVDLAAPEADAELATACADVEATCTDKQTVSFAEGLGVKSFEVTWSPESEDGKAGYSTSYTALIRLCADDGFEDVEKALASGATVTCNGVAAEAAGFTVVDDKLCLAVTFPATRAVGVKSVSQPEPVEVSFEDAAAGSWSLPKIVLVTLENGEVVDADVTWEPVEGFSANAIEAQELTVKGTITDIAYDGELDTEDLDRNVSVTVKVAAPQKDADDESDDKKGDTKKDDDTTKTETTTTTTTKTAAKKGTPSTGDVTWGGFAGLLVLAVVCLVAARISRREH